MLVNWLWLKGLEISSGRRRALQLGVPVGSVQSIDQDQELFCHPMTMIEKWPAGCLPSYM